MMRAMTAKAAKGHEGYYAGLAAEDMVQRDYERRGRPVAARRWRGQCGEIDLIFREGEALVFVEVKKSRTHAQAAGRLGRRQMDRLYGAASEFLAGEPRGQLTDVRFDLATVDSFGTVQIIENAFMDM